MAEIFWGTHRYPAPRSVVDVRAIPGRHVRSDIQGLRAIAVLSVLVSHVWPGLIPGGFVGVDVFFVISGFVITGSLFHELQRTGDIALWRFYARRMKRLLPAAMLVLIVVAFLTVWLLPPSRWEDTAIEILASAFYLENWRLAWLAVDYWAADNAASPVQHFWSLSIEEQFYAFWPLMLIAAAAVSRRFTDLRTAVLASLVLIVAASFGASVLLTETNREAAYFLTHTRIWQLGVGGLLAVAALPDFSRRTREAMRTAGLAGIGLAIAAYSPATAFPGYAALLPTLGCALVLAAGTDSDAWSLSRLLEARPMQYVGDISYSVYLWHWPIIVFANLHAQGGMTPLLGLAIVAATIAIAHLSKRFVEDPVRYAQFDARRGLALAAGIAACCFASAATLYHHVAPQLIETYTESPDYPGARAILAGAVVPYVAGPMPPPVFLKNDKGEPYKANCHLGFKGTNLNHCQYGPETGTRVVLMGDSHAAHWAPALISQVNEMGWRLEIHTKSACPVLREAVRKNGEPYRHCRRWGENLLQYLRASPPDLVIVSQAKMYEFAEAGGRTSRADVADAVADVWRELLGLGIKVVAIRDTPKLPFDPGECLAREPGCHAEQSKVLTDADPILMAHHLVPQVPVVDMTDAVCQDGRCPMVIGNIVVWRDSGHLTASYSRTVATVLAARIAEAASGLQASLSP